jgi:hypothetical protein
MSLTQSKTNTFSFEFPLEQKYFYPEIKIPRVPQRFAKIIYEAVGDIIIETKIVLPDEFLGYDLTALGHAIASRVRADYDKYKPLGASCELENGASEADEFAQWTEHNAEQQNLEKE